MSWGQVLGLLLAVAGLLVVTSHVFSNDGGASPAGNAYPLGPVLGGMTLVTGAILLTVFGNRRLQ